MVGLFGGGFFGQGGLVFVLDCTFLLVRMGAIAILLQCLYLALGACFGFVFLSLLGPGLVVTIALGFGLCLPFPFPRWVSSHSVSSPEPSWLGVRARLLEGLAAGPSSVALSATRARLFLPLYVLGDFLVSVKT